MNQNDLLKMVRKELPERMGDPAVGETEIENPFLPNKVAVDVIYHKYGEGTMYSPMVRAIYNNGIFSLRVKDEENSFDLTCTESNLIDSIVGAFAMLKIFEKEEDKDNA